MKKTLYKKGFLIRVTSWENDADNYKTKEVNVDTEERAKQVVKFCWLFGSRRLRGDRGIGNIHGDYHADEVDGAQKVLIQFYHDNPNFFDEIPEDPDYIGDWMIDFAYDLGLSGGEYYTRVCEKVEVFYFDQDVTCEELSREFKPQ